MKQWIAEDVTLLEDIKSIAAKVGIDVDVEMGAAIKVGIDGVKSIAKPGEGESSLDGLTRSRTARRSIRLKAAV